jgi:hypothetical protein
VQHTVSSLLGQKDEFFNLVVYLWNNPPSYISLPAEPKQIPGGASPNPFGGSSPNMGGGRAFGGGAQQSNPFGDPYQAQEQQVRVDTALARTALRTANEAKEMGAATLLELQSQAEQIDRIEGNVERIHSRLNETNTLLRGIESLPAYIGNKFKKDKKQPPPVVDPPDRTVRNNFDPQSFVDVSDSWRCVFIVDQGRAYHKTNGYRNSMQKQGR